MKRKLKIEQKIKENLIVETLNVENVSESHRGHDGFIEGIETHFNIFVVSEVFKNLNKIERQRILNNLLKNEFKNNLHSVSYTLLTKSEFKKN